MYRVGESRVRRALCVAVCLGVAFTAKPNKGVARVALFALFGARPRGLSGDRRRGRVQCVRVHRTRACTCANRRLIDFFFSGGRRLAT